MSNMHTVFRSVKSTLDWLQLPWTAKRAMIEDRMRVGSDPGLVATMHLVASWLATAQDCTASRDGGVARDYSLLRGWATSYPETTGYIVPTVLKYASWAEDPSFRSRAKRMLDWLLSIQMPSGAFQGGRIDSKPVTPVVFNTGQILIGLACGAREYGEPYLTAMRRAADWLVDVQDPDGCWRGGASPFAMDGDKTYDTHVAWGLLEAHRTALEPRYLKAALQNVGWALSHQSDNGWMANCCLSDPEQPLTHTLGYALRGIVEAYLESGEDSFLAGARRLGDALLSTIEPDGFMAGRFYGDWSPAVRWSCLTGSVQISSCWMLLHKISSDSQYLEAAKSVNCYVRKTIRPEGTFGIVGGVKGSHPIDGEYGRFEYLNWSAKFLLDALFLEEEIDGSSAG